MTAWDFRYVVVAAFVASLIVAVWLLRVGTSKERKKNYECGACGHIQWKATERPWRFCPYCGAPKGAVGVGSMGKKSEWNFHKPES